MPGAALAVAVTAVTWCAVAGLAAVLPAALAPVLPSPLAAAVYAAGGFICHQIPDRSFHWHGAQLAVCARCTGIYVGACASAFLAPLPPSVYARWGAPSRIAW